VTTPAPVERYDGIAQALHWLTFGLLAISIPVAIVLAKAPPEGALKFRLYTLHESIGLTVWLITVARLVWRVRHPPPVLANMPHLLARLRHVVHGGLYALLLTMPIVGWAGGSAFGFPPDFWWLVQLPPITPQDKTLGAFLIGAHKALGYALIVLLAFHVIAALFHHFAWKDGTLTRMMPRPRSG
jgi:cytochrome b561